MTAEPAGAASILAAFRRASVEPDPHFGLCEGFAILLGSHGRGVLSHAMRGEITVAFLNTGNSAKRLLLRLSEHDRSGEDSFGAVFTLLFAWASPIGSPLRASETIRLRHIHLRIVANDLDSICAGIELRRGEAAPVPAQPEAPAPVSVH